MFKKVMERQRRAKRGRMRMRSVEAIRLCIHRTPRHMYAQVISSAGDKIIASASTLDATFKGQSTGNRDAATAVGKLIAERAREAGVEKVAFDRSGFRYHGRVQALADAARESGLKF